MQKPLEQRSLSEIRGIAQSLGIPDIFSKDAKHLLQDISLKRDLATKPKITLPPLPPFDARMMDKSPSRRSNPKEIVEVLEPYIKLGLKLSFDEHGERWYARYGERTDEAPTRMPLRQIILLIHRLMG